MRPLLWFISGAIALAVIAGGGGLIWFKTRANGLSTRVEPSAFERWLALRARSLSLPAGASSRENPVLNTPQVLAEARAHWADHCATCHSNDGSGDAEIGKRMYPPAPDMRKSGTQNLTDGELFYIIQNGIRFTGMPSWGGGAAHDEQDSWKLVRFIRHLPDLTQDEQRQMETLNPKTPEERQEEEEEKEFLNGGQPHEHKHEHL
jgi:mono/diheme cytochrome c family protein